MNNGTNIRVVLVMAMLLSNGLPSLANRGGGGHGGGHPVARGGYRGGHGYHHGVGYGYPAYYAPAYNDYGYRGYPPYPQYGTGVGVGVAAAAGALIGGLLAAKHGH